MVLDYSIGNMSIFSALAKRLKNGRLSKRAQTGQPTVDSYGQENGTVFRSIPKLTGFKAGSGGQHARVRRQEHSRQILATKQSSQARKRNAALAAGIDNLGNLGGNLRPNLRGLKLSFRSRALRWVMALLLLVGAGYGAARVAQQQGLWLVQEVSLLGQASQSARKDFDSKAIELIGQNIFELNSTQLTSSLQESPFIREAYVRKRFPNTIEVELVEAVPEVKLVSLSGVKVYDQAGQEIFNQQGQEAASLNEAERIMYIEGKPFKNEIVKALWQQAEEQKLREQYLRDNPVVPPSPSSPVVPTAPATVVNPGGTGLPAAPPGGASVAQIADTSPADEQKWQDFLARKFSELPINAIAGYYNQARSTITFSVNEIWQANSKLVDLGGAESYELFSLVDIGADSNPELQKLTSSQANINQIYSQLKDLNPTGIEIVSDFTYRVRLAESSQFLDNSYVYFSLRKDLSEQISELMLLTQELASSNRRVQKIDLTGEKVVVS